MVGPPGPPGPTGDSIATTEGYANETPVPPSLTEDDVKDICKAIIKGNFYFILIYLTNF